MEDLHKYELALIAGDLSKLNESERLAYYKSVCESVGLNPLTTPFSYITLNGKLVLYAKRDATDQLRKIHRVSIEITKREVIEGVYIVTAKATDSSGRYDESTGAVTITGLKGDQLANAYLKAETKSKRRVTLSICGLGLLDETEVETIPEVKDAQNRPPQSHPVLIGKEHRADKNPSQAGASNKGTPSPVTNPFTDEQKAKGNPPKLEIITGKDLEAKLKNEAPVDIAMASNLINKLDMLGKNNEKFYLWLDSTYGVRIPLQLKVWQYEEVLNILEKK